jgi:hypothetical protein
MVLQPGKLWVIERAVDQDESTDAMLKTCFMRGWVEPLQDSIPSGRLNPDGSLPAGPLFTNRRPVWRLTESGWGAIQRSHELTVLGLFLAVVAVVVTLAQ